MHNYQPLSRQSALVRTKQLTRSYRLRRERWETMEGARSEQAYSSLHIHGTDDNTFGPRTATRQTLLLTLAMMRDPAASVVKVVGSAIDFKHSGVSHICLGTIGLHSVEMHWPCLACEACASDSGAGEGDSFSWDTCGVCFDIIQDCPKHNTASDPTRPLAPVCSLICGECNHPVCRTCVVWQNMGSAYQDPSLIKVGCRICSGCCDLCGGGARWPKDDGGMGCSGQKLPNGERCCPTERFFCFSSPDGCPNAHNFA